MIPIATDLDRIAQYIASPLELTETLPEHLVRKANACALIASILLDNPFRTVEEMQNMVIKVYPELTKGTLYTYIRDTKYIYGQLDPMDRAFERLGIKAQIGKCMAICYKEKDMRAAVKLLELYMKLYRLDKPDALSMSADQLKQSVTNIFMMQTNEFVIGDKVVPLDKFIDQLQAQLDDEKKAERVEIEDIESEEV